MFSFFKRARKRSVRTVAWRVRVETETRFGYVTPNGTINFAELLNNCHPFVEAMRRCLAEYDPEEQLTDAERAFIAKVFETVDDVNYLLDKWGAAYTSWLSIFKSRSKEAKNILQRSNEWIYEEIQTFYRHSAEFYEDASKVISSIKRLEASSITISENKE